ncbi:MAG: 50S ribosomal protein L2 [Planctomycetes bacterium]|nr:50S ribosomal protein L2 [Planctomycetota bacterium]
MAIKAFKPTSNGRRNMTSQDFSMVTRKGPEKALTEKLPRKGGRNAHGHITAAHRGGGHPRQYRTIDFKRDKDGVPARVAAIEYDPNRSTRIALLHYRDGEKRYILCPEGVRVGSTVESGRGVDPRVGNAMPLNAMPLGSIIHNVELIPGEGGRMVRSAGGAARLSARDSGYAHITLPSGEVRKVPDSCRATLGQLSNSEHRLVNVGKAGRNRHRGNRPHVRGMAMNPVDHPMGGGSSRRKGRQPQSRTGVLAKGGKTRRPKARTNSLIVRKRTKKRR